MRLYQEVAHDCQRYPSKKFSRDRFRYVFVVFLYVVVILMDRFGPDNFSTLPIKGHVLHRAGAHLKVPG